LGLTKKMIDFSIEFRRKTGIKFTYFITNNPIIVKLNLKSKLASLFPHSIANLVWIDDIDLQMKAMPIDNAWFMKIGFHAAKFINKLKNAVSRTRPVSKDLDVSEVHRFDDRINEFWEKISKYYNFIAERNLGFLIWRYCDRRAGGFVVKQVEEDGQLLGYVVLKINRYRRDYPVGFIVDLLTLPERLDVADTLVADAVHYFESHDINIINYQVVRGHPYERALKKHGFLDSRIKSYLFISSFELEDELYKLKESPKSKVYFSYGDIDSLPISMPG